MVLLVFGAINKPVASSRMPSKPSPVIELIFHSLIGCTQYCYAMQVAIVQKSLASRFQTY